MPQRKSRPATFTGRVRQRSNSSTARTVEQARATLIAECLRDLVGAELIYAIRCPDGVIKIGHTRNLSARRRHFDTTPEAILAIKPGTYAEEQAVHTRLSGSVARGQEYYHPTPEVLAYVNDLRSALGIQPVE
jgi:hypothetical protein